MFPIANETSVKVSKVVLYTLYFVPFNISINGALKDAVDIIKDECGL